MDPAFLQGPGPPPPSRPADSAYNSSIEEPVLQQPPYMAREQTSVSDSVGYYRFDPTPYKEDVEAQRPVAGVPVATPAHGGGGGTGAAATAKPLCCGLSQKAAIITAVVLVVLVAAGVGVGVGVPLALKKSDDSPSPPSPPPPVAPAPPPSPDPPVCTTDDSCRTAGVFCVAGTCTDKSPPGYLCSSDRECFYDSCHSKSPAENATCLYGEGAQCNTNAIGDCAGACLANGFCSSNPNVPVAVGTFVNGAACRVDAECGVGALCIDSQCTKKYPEFYPCQSRADCFSNACAVIPGFEDAGSICLRSSGRRCGGDDQCASGICGSDMYCL